MKWIKHDTDANQDAKLQNVLLDYGLEGYGLYWYCIELIAGKVDKDNITFELEHDARIIARNVGSTPQKVEEMMRYFVEIGLFENSQGVITCLKLARRLDKSMTSNPQMREIIDKFKSHDGVMTASEKPMQDKIRSDQNTLDKKDHGSSDDKPSAKKGYPEEFEWIWANKPDREGANPKRKACQACNARIKQGATWREMAEGMNRYKAYCQQTKIIGTRVVQQMATFFGPDEHFKNEWKINDNPKTGQSSQNNQQQSVRYVQQDQEKARQELENL